MGLGDHVEGGQAGGNARDNAKAGFGFTRAHSGAASRSDRAYALCMIGDDIRPIFGSEKMTIRGVS